MRKIEWKVKLMGFQKEGVEFGKKHRYVIIGDEMGLGKTPQGMTIGITTGSNTLIVCPAYLKYNWYEDINKFVGNFDAQVIENKNTDVDYLNDILITNYEQLMNFPELFSWADTIVVDEAHYLKNLEAQRTHNFHKLIKSTPPDRLVLMTGTPIKNKVGEFYSLLCLCGYSPRANNGLRVQDYYKTQTAFNEEFSNKRIMKFGGRKIVEFEGVRNVPLLKTFLKDKMIRRMSKDVLDLPKMINKQVVVSFKKDASLQYEWDNKGKITDNDISGKTKSAINKIPFTLKYINDLLDSGVESLVVFSHHIKPIRDICDKLKVKADFIDGSVPPKKRQEKVEGFQSGRIKVLCCTIGAASTGITLHQSNHIVFNDISWVPTDNDQAMKRINRIGQDRTCFYHFIYGSLTDQHIAQLVLKKSKVIKEVLG